MHIASTRGSGKTSTPPSLCVFIHLVDVLPARTPGACRLDLDVLGPDVDSHVINLRHHRHRSRAGVHAPLSLRRRHALFKTGGGRLQGTGVGGVVVSFVLRCLLAIRPSVACRFRDELQDQGERGGARESIVLVVRLAQKSFDHISRTSLATHQNPSERKYRCHELPTERERERER